MLLCGREQVLGEVYPSLEGRRGAAIDRFRDATGNKGANSPDLWHIFAELLSQSDLPGELHLQAQCRMCTSDSTS